MYFSKIFQILFIVGSTFLIFIPGYLNFHGGSHHHSQHLMTKEEFLLNLAPFSSRFVILACCHPLIIIFDCGNSFHPSGEIQESSQFVIRSSSIQGYSFTAFSSRSPNLIGASFKCSLIISESLRSLVSKFSQASSFIC